MRKLTPAYPLNQSIYAFWPINIGKQPSIYCADCSKNGPTTRNLIQKEGIEMAIVLALTPVIIATVILLRLGRFSARAPFQVSSLGYVDAQFKFQVLLMGVAACMLGTVYFLNRTNFLTFFARGNIAAPAKPVWWLLVPGGTSWATLGAILCCFITFGTSVFVYLQFRRADSMKAAAPFILWILLFSFTNALSEEVIYRLGIIVPLVGKVNTVYILLLSAIAFGAPHLRGMPNGIVGALMAGFLGWLLAKSVVETHGIFWAWFIHFLQDVVIFTAFVMTAARRLD